MHKRLPNWNGSVSTERVLALFIENIRAARYYLVTYDFRRKKQPVGGSLASLIKDFLRKKCFNQFDKICHHI